MQGLACAAVCLINRSPLFDSRNLEGLLPPASYNSTGSVTLSLFLHRSLRTLLRQALRASRSARPFFHSTNVECPDRVQLVVSTIIACAETSRLPTVTCRPENEEAVSLRTMFAKWDKLHKRERPPVLSPELQEKTRKEKEWIAAIPYCGRVKFHPPTALALIPDNLKDAPDLFQTAEWFGSGGSAFRLTLASERFVNLARERRWRGLVFHSASPSGWSERTSI
jgi:hypothetical protein